MITKRRMLSINLLVCALLGMDYLFYSYAHPLFSGDSCWNNAYFLGCSTVLLYYILLLSIPVLLISIITYFMKDDVFNAWKRFTFTYLPIYILVVLASPWRASSFSPFEKGPVTLLILAIYVLISVLIIIWKYVRTRNK
jgi:uncharacterized membrane protein